jgi:hypothetical protein
MEFNRFLWNLYRDSEEGRSAIRRDVAEHMPSELKDSTAFIHSLYFYEIAKGEVVENGIKGTEDVDLRKFIGEYAAQHNSASLDDAERIFAEIVDEGLSWQFDDESKSFEAIFGGGKYDQEGYSEILESIEGLSAGLHDAHPEFFFPYLFQRRFDVFEKICQSFDISLPQIPGKLQKRERALYYLAINRTLYKFRNDHSLSPQELNAFLCDFAPKNITLRPVGELPPPSRI